MKTMRYTAALLAFLLVLGLFPGEMGKWLATPAQAADYTISSSSDWNAFANGTGAFAGGGEYSGDIIELTADITLSGAVKVVEKDFKGTFNGNGYKITLNGSPYFDVDNARRTSGLFRYVIGGTIKNLIVEIDGNLWSNKTSSSQYQSNNVPNDFGVIAGQIQQNATITQCAVIGKTSSAKLSHYKAWSNQNPAEVCAGGIVGRVIGNSTVQECMVAINIDTALTKDTSNFWAYTGGVVGRLESGTVDANGYWGRINFYHVDPTRGSASCGAVVGYAYNGSVTNNTADAEIYVYDVNEVATSGTNLVLESGVSSSKNMNMGGVAGHKINASYQNNYGTAYGYRIDGVTGGSNSVSGGGVGFTSTNISKLSSTWSTAASGKKMLEWMLKYSDPIAVDIDTSEYDSKKVKVIVTPPFVDLDQSGGTYESSKDATWKAYLKYPIAGRQATPSGMTLQTGGGSSSVTSVALTDKPLETTTLYNGATYEFQATVAGNNLDENTVKNDNALFKFEYLNGSGTPVGTAITNKEGTVNIAIPAGANQLRVTASYQGQSASQTYTTLSLGEIGAISIAGEQPLQGTQVQMQANITGSQSFIDSVQWSIAPKSGTPLVSGTVIDANTGVLSIDSAEPKDTVVVVTATTTGVTPVTKEVTVGEWLAPALSVVSMASDSSANTNVTIRPGDSIDLKVDRAANWSGNGASGTDMDTITANPSASGVVTATFVDNVTDPANPVTYTATFNITVRELASKTSTETPAGYTRSGDAVVVSSTAAGYTATINGSSSAGYQYLVDTMPTAPADGAAWLDYSGGIPLDGAPPQYVHIRTKASGDRNASNILNHIFNGTTLSLSSGTIDTGAASTTKTSSPHQDVGSVTGEVNFTLEGEPSGVGNVIAYVYPSKPRYATGLGAAADYYRVTEATETLGGASREPVITLNTDASKGYGVVIAGKDANTSIYYTTAKAGAVPQTPTASSTLYDGSIIPFPADTTQFTVWAIARDEGASMVSQVTKATFRKDDLAKEQAPQLRMGDGLIFSSGTYYEPGTAVHFYHEKFDANATGSNANSIRYIVDGGTPSISAGTSYKASAPYVLPSNKSTVTVRAILIDATSLMESELLEVTVNIRHRLPAPQPVAYEGVDYTAPVRPDSSAYLSLNSEAVEQLNTLGNRFELITYSQTLDTGAGVTLEPGSPQPVLGMTYLSYTESTGNTLALPQIRYQTGDNDVAAMGLPYTYGLRVLTEVYDSVSGTTTTTVRYTNPAAITLLGQAKGNFKLSVMAVSSADTYSDSLAQTYIYTFRDAIAAVTSYPRTTADNPTSVQTGDMIELTTDTADAIIFYSMGNNRPKVEYLNGAWVIQDSNTMRYNPDSPIQVTGSSRLMYTINAIAVSPTNSLESSSGSFQYQLPAPVQAVTINPAGGAVVKGTKVTLHCATEGATIYYTTDGETPVMYESNVYDAKNPPVIEKKATITAMAELNGVTSTITSSEFKLSTQMSEPTASLPTGHVVSKGTRIALSAGGTIAYTTDGKDPRSILESEASSTSKSEDGNKVFYGDTVVIDGDYGDSVTIRAYSYRSGYTPSETVSFTYTVCERDDYLVANPVAGTVVKPGSVIQLSTSVTNGRIFYAIGDSTPQVKNTYSSSFSFYRDDLLDDYEAYQWEAVKGTTEGNTIEVPSKPGTSFTIRAIAITDGAEGGVPRVFNFQINERSDAPTASIPSGAITFNGATTALSAKEGAAIYYTADGTEPTTSSYRYTEPVRLEGSVILKAMAVEEGKEPSEVVEYTYTQAGYAAAVTMSVTGGEVEQGTKVAMSTLTEGATIYYTTNGTEPTTDSQVYTASISVMRPVTFKAMAYLQGLHASAVNTTTFTVVEPEPEPEEEGDDSNRRLTQTDRLTSRRTYDEYVGPTYTDVVIQNSDVGALLAAEEGVVEKDSSLVVREVATTPSDRNVVRAQMDYSIVRLYDIHLERSGEKIQPNGTVEIGLPIPPENRNGIVVVAYLGDDGTLEAFPTRRSDDMAYFMTSHFSKYAIVVPEAQQAGAGSMLLVGLISGLATLGIAGLLFLLVRRRKKKPGTGS